MVRCCKAVSSSLCCRVCCPYPDLKDMDLALVVDEVIKLFEHVGPCIALLLILHAQNLLLGLRMSAKLDALKKSDEKGD
jgi:hypothetical protein